jgi:acetyl esterase/lipase
MDSLQRLLHLPFAKIDELELLVDVIRPADTDTVSPAIIYVHGGGWATGHRSDTPNQLLVESGFATFSISYRFSHEAIFPAAIHDVKAAIRWIRANATDLRIDPARIGIWGHSAGGHLASLAALTGDLPELEGDSGSPGSSSAIQAAVPLAGPSWFPAESMYRDAAVAKLLGAHQTEVPDVAAFASPVAHVSTDAPPFLIVHGDADTVVPISQSELLDEKLHGAGLESELIRVEGAGHDYPDLLTPDVVAHVAHFFWKHLN